jgi:hypothetical protein
MTPTEITEKAAILSKERGRKVYPLVVNGEDNEQIIGFVEEPKRQAKFAAIDLLAKEEITRAGEMLLSSTLIKEVSDYRMSSDSEEHDSIVIGAAMACVSLVQTYSGEIKKN